MMRYPDVKRMSVPARVAAAVGGAVGVALLVAACGSGSSSTSAPATSAPATSAPASSAPAGGSSASAAAAGGSASTVITTASSSAGTFLTNGSGRAVYLWVKDGNGMSACSGACAGAWPPVTTTGTVTASGGAKASDLGTITRSDGTRQVTYDGHPLYFFAGDSGAGMASGQGSDSFGAKWWLISPSGGDVTAAVGSFTTDGSGSSPAPSAPAATHSSSAGGGWS